MTTKTNTNTTETYSKFDEALDLVRGLKNENDKLKSENEKLKEENRRLNAVIKDYVGTLKSLYNDLAGDLDVIIDTIGYERISPATSPATAAKPAAAQPARHETKQTVPESRKMTSEEANHYMAELLMNMFN